MKLVYTHPNIAILVQAYSPIEQAEIECVLRNEYASGAMGELAPINAWPEVWVVYDTDFVRAVSIVETSHRAVEGQDWQCAQCTTYSPATFDTCWQCGGERF
ncbi:MAG: DUF2007 domain-containing protein [Halioglobus sp.]|nr:DUF2007 domain-containing protein [Halioglobus sp.]